MHKFRLSIFLLMVFKTILGCNPLKDSTCFVKNQALSDDLINFKESDFEILGDVHHDGTNTVMKLNKRYDNPMVSSKFYILYGKVECEILASKGQGIISSFYLQSDDLDEIDIAELFGGNNYQVQSNFFIKGNTTTWDRGGYHNIRDPLEFYNRYTVEWTPNLIKWWVNDQLIRALEKDNDYGIPESPMSVKFSLWAGGDEANAKGTILWSGGLTDYQQLPYEMKFKHLKVSDYSTGNVYSYGNLDGHWETLSSDGIIGGRDSDFLYIQGNPHEYDDAMKQFE